MGCPAAVIAVGSTVFSSVSAGAGSAVMSTSDGER